MRDPWNVMSLKRGMGHRKISLIKDTRRSWMKGTGHKAELDEGHGAVVVLFI